MEKIAAANANEPVAEFKKNFPPRQQFLAQPGAARGVHPRKVHGLDEIYEGYQKVATEDQATTAEETLPIRSVHKNLEMNLANKRDKEAFKT